MGSRDSVLALRMYVIGACVGVAATELYYIIFHNTGLRSLAVVLLAALVFAFVLRRIDREAPPLFEVSKHV